MVVLARDTNAARKALGDAESNVRVAGWSLERGTVRDDWEREVRAATAVVNLAGAGIMDAPWTESRKRELYASRVDVTRALAETFARRSASSASSDAPPVFVSGSAVGIYGMCMDDAWLTEASAHGTDLLADVCLEWERAANPAREAGARVVHPRLGIVLGRDGGALTEIVRPFKLHAGGPIGSGDQWVSWIHEQDVIGAMELALESATFVGPYNFVAPEPVTMRVEAQTIADVLHTHARARVPAFVIKTILGAERAEAVLTGQRASANRLTAAGYAFAFSEIRPALEDLLAPPPNGR